MRMATLAIRVDEVALEDFCRRHGVRWLAAFGSAVRDDFRPDSDLDLLVQFDEHGPRGWSFFGLADELAAMFGRTVDLITPAELSRHYRDDVLRSAVTLYGRP